VISRYDYFIIAGYLVFLASIGFVFRRFNRGSKDYFAGGFQMTWWLLGASSFISNFSCWTFTGGADIAYTFGILVFAVSFVDVLGFALSAVWFAPRFRQLRVITAMDAVRLRFGPFNEQFFNWLQIVNALLTGAVWLVGLSIILSVAFALPQGAVILCTAAVVLVISLLGGNWAVVASDFIQLLLLMGITIVTAVLTLVKIGGIHAFLHQVPPDRWVFFKPLGSAQYDWLYIVSTLAVALYSKNNMAIFSKYIPAKDGREARRTALVPMVGYIIMPIFWFIPPLAAFTLAPHLIQHSMLKPGETTYIAVCVAVLPRGLLGLMIAAMFSATIAAMDVALNKNAGFLVKNFYQPILRKGASDGELLAAGKVATLLCAVTIALLAVLLAHRPDLPLRNAYLYLGAYVTMPIAVPLVLGMLMRKTPRWAAWAAVVFGALLAIFFYNILPTAALEHLLSPVLGGRVYHYLAKNPLFTTNIIAFPLTCGFFMLSRRWYRPADDVAYAREVDEFFRRMNTPVDFQREVGADNTHAQAKLLGTLGCVYGSFILVLVLIPNPLSGRLGIFACAAMLLGAGVGLLLYARHLARKAPEAAELARPGSPLGLSPTGAGQPHSQPPSSLSK
jgi:Na+/proline symporter